jgi:hypothetical protein
VSTETRFIPLRFRHQVRRGNCLSGAERFDRFNFESSVIDPLPRVGIGTSAMAGSRGPAGNARRRRLSISLTGSASCVMYPWPIFDGSFTLDDALRIAMDYLERTGQAEPYYRVQSVAADTILTAWRAGVRHKLRLANSAIRAIEQNPPSENLYAFYPRAG